MVTQLLAMRKGRLEQMVNLGTGWVRMEYLVPARGLIGFRTEFLTETRGTGPVHHVFDRWEPWPASSARGRRALVADRRGTTPRSHCSTSRSAAAVRWSRRRRLRGHDRRREPRADDLDVNPTKEKHLTNIRSSTAESWSASSQPRALPRPGARAPRADESSRSRPSRPAAQGRARHNRAAPADPGGEGVTAQVLAQLSVRRGREAVEFYKQAFGAIEVYRVGGPDSRNEAVVSQLAVGDESSPWVADESPEHLDFSPETVGGGTVRLLLIVDDPDAAIERAVAAGATIVRPAANDARLAPGADRRPVRAPLGGRQAAAAFAAQAH